MCMWEGVPVWELARRRGFGTPAGSGCLIRDMIVQDSRDDSPVFITPPSGFYLRKLLAWPGFGFYLHKLKRMEALKYFQ